MRYRRRKAANENDQSQSQADFIAGGKIPARSRTNGPESRIDTEAMAQRRQSDGSIADNEDFSRRILKVSISYLCCDL